MEGGLWVLGAGGMEPAEDLPRTTSERGSRQMDMEAEPGSSAEALLSDGSYAAAVVAEPVAAAAVAAADQTAYLGGGWVPAGGRRWTEGQPSLLAGGTGGALQRRPAANPPVPPG